MSDEVFLLLLWCCISARYFTTVCVILLALMHMKKEESNVSKQYDLGFFCHKYWHMVSFRFFYALRCVCIQLCLRQNTFFSAHSKKCIFGWFQMFFIWYYLFISMKMLSVFFSLKVLNLSSEKKLKFQGFIETTNKRHLSRVFTNKKCWSWFSNAFQMIAWKNNWQLQLNKFYLLFLFWNRIWTVISDYL